MKTNFLNEHYYFRSEVYMNMYGYVYTMIRGNLEKLVLHCAAMDD